MGKGYFGESASKYDKRRFETEHGKLFHFLEMEQLEKGISGLKKDALICEVGCGTARFSRYLAEKGFNVVATDISFDMLKIAKEKCSGIKNIKFYISEGSSLNFNDEKFDFVFAIRVLNQTESEDYALNTLREMIRITKFGGIILVEFVNKLRLFNNLRSRAGVQLSFDKICEIAEKNNCKIIKKSGILIFSEAVLNSIPKLILPIYKFIECFFAKLLRKYTTRGYVLLEKTKNISK